MKKVIDDERLMVKICDMYYNQDLNQKVISAQLGLSRPTVSRIISNGKERGIVKIIIDNLEGTDYVELEREIENLYGLREVIVVDTKKDIEDQKTKLAGLPPSIWSVWLRTATSSGYPWVRPWGILPDTLWATRPRTSPLSR